MNPKVSDYIVGTLIALWLAWVMISCLDIIQNRGASMSTKPLFEIPMIHFMEH